MWPSWSFPVLGHLRQSSPLPPHCIISDAQAEQFKGQVYLAVNAMDVLLWGGITLSVVMVLAAAWCFMTAYLRHRSKARYAAVVTASYYSDYYRPLHGPDGLPLTVEGPPQASEAPQVGWTQVQ